MNEMIPIQYENENPTVSGRELSRCARNRDAIPQVVSTHARIRVFREQGLSDIFVRKFRRPPGSRPRDIHSNGEGDCMLQRTDKGKQCRAYFISCEEAWNSPDKIMERALQIAHRRASEAERRIFGLLEEKGNARNCAERVDPVLHGSEIQRRVQKGVVFGAVPVDWQTTLGVQPRARHTNRKCETNDERFGAVNSYPISAWDDFMEVGLYA